MYARGERVARELQRAGRLHHREDTLIAVGLATTHFVLDAGMDLVLQLLELAMRQRVAREGPQPLGAVELNARVVEVLAEVVAILRDTLPKTIQIELEVPERLWMVDADPTQLNQIVMNLCVNARDAIGSQGRLRLSVGSHHTHAPSGPPRGSGPPRPSSCRPWPQWDRM